MWRGSAEWLCNACKTPTAMIATKLAKFSGVVRIIGVILLIPSFLGIGFAALILLSAVITTGDVMLNAQTEKFQRVGRVLEPLVN